MEEDNKMEEKEEEKITVGERRMWCRKRLSGGGGIE